MAQVIPLQRARHEPDRCRAQTATGRPCRNRAGASGFCHVHEPPAAPDRIGPFDDEGVHEALHFLTRRLTGDYEVDVFGFDPELTERVLLPIIRTLYRHY